MLRSSLAGLAARSRGLAYLKHPTLCRYSYDGTLARRSGRISGWERPLIPCTEKLHLTTPCSAIYDRPAYVVFALPSEANAEKSSVALLLAVDFVRLRRAIFTSYGMAYMMA